MRSWTLRGKLLAIPAFTALMLLVASIMVLQAHRQYERRIHSAMNQELEERRLVVNALAQVAGAHMRALENARRPDSPQLAPRATELKNLRQATVAMRIELDRQRDDSDSMDPRVAALAAAHSDLLRYESAIAAYEALPRPNDEDARRLMRDIDGAFESLDSRMRVLLQAKHSSTQASLAAAEIKVARDWKLIGAYIVIAGLMVLAACWMLAGGISKRLNKLLVASRNLADNVDGPLDVDTRNNDEVSELARGLTGAADRIRERDGALRRAVDDAMNVGKLLRAEIEDRRKVETNLRRTTEFLALAQAAGGFGIFDLDLPSGMIHGSPMFFELLGIETTDTSLTRDEWLSSIHPEDLDSFVQQFTHAVESGSQYQTEYRSLWPNGIVRWLTGRGRVMRDVHGDPTRVIGTITDITARRQLEEQLRKTTESLIIAQSSAGVATFDFDIAAQNFTCSDNFFDLMCVPRTAGPLDLEKICASVHVDDRPAQTSMPVLTADEDTTYRREFRVMMDNGEVRWLNERGNLVRAHDGTIQRVTGAIVDISDRKAAEAAVVSAEHRLQRAVQGTQDGLFEVTLKDRRMWVTPRFEHMLGYETGACPAQNDVLSMIHPDDVPQVQEQFDNFATHGSAFDLELRVRHRQSHYEWVRCRAQGVKDKGGTVVGLAGSIQLVSDRRKAQEATLEAMRVAEAANSAKSEFLANMSHEIRTPMNGVIGVARLLGETELDKMQRDYVDIIRGSAETLLSLLNDLLDFSKIEAGRLELEKIEFELRSPIYETCSAMALQGAVKGIELIANTQPDVPHLMQGDPGRLRQIVSNLISNALKFTHEGQVVVDTRRVGGDADNAIVKIEVTDTGIGIPSDRMDRLFKQFTQVDSSTTRHYGGTGLGLSIVKRLTELMGGTVGVRSTPGRGSSFWVTIPFQLSGNEVPLEPVGRGHVVLVVDDIEASRSGLKSKLEAFSYECVTAASVDEALGILNARNDIDLVVADEIMPLRGGLDLLNRMRDSPATAKIPFLLLAMIGAHLSIDSLPHKPDAVVQKPIRGRLVANMAAALIAGETAPMMMTTVAAPNAPSALNARVLLVEDNAVNQRVAQRMLQKMNVEVVTCNNGAEALDCLAHDGHFDAVLMDCQMPVMDGFTATRRIRDLEAKSAHDLGVSRRLPIIALTANVMREDRDRCIAAGMDAHLGKPIQPSQLRDCLSRFVSENLGSAIDEQALHDLTGGDSEFERELIETFIASGDQNLADIIDALGRRDYVTIGNRAHALKGSSANMHAVSLSSAAASLEQAARKYTNQNLNELVDQLAARLNEVNSQLRRTG